MITENLIYYAIAVFILMIIGLALTYLEFRYGNPRKQQEKADKQHEQAVGLQDSTATPPVR